MRVLGLIPARGGSKGVPRKNIRPLGGKPLLQWTAEAALAAKSLERVVLSTEDDEIAEVGRSCGVDVPFMRPRELAQDETPMLPVVQHALRAVAHTDGFYDAVCLLQPTHPLRLATDIDAAVEMLQQTGADSVVSFVDVGGAHPARMKYLGADNRVIDPPFAEEFEGQRRQDLPALVLREGSVYLTRRRTVLHCHSLKGKDCRALMIPPERACDIDVPLDFLIAERLLELSGVAS